MASLIPQQTFFLAHSLFHFKEDMKLGGYKESEGSRLGRCPLCLTFSWLRVTECYWVTFPRLLLLLSFFWQTEPFVQTQPAEARGVAADAAEEC